MRWTASAGDSPQPVMTTTDDLPRLGPLRMARTPLLDVAYVDAGPPTGDPALLLHGFPYDVHSYIDRRSEGVVRPVARAGEALVRVRAAGIDRGVWQLMTGRPTCCGLPGTASGDRRTADDGLAGGPRPRPSTARSVRARDRRLRRRRVVRRQDRASARGTGHRCRRHRRAVDRIEGQRTRKRPRWSPTVSAGLPRSTSAADATAAAGPSARAGRRCHASAPPSVGRHWI